MSTSGRSYKFLKNKYLICIVVFVVWMSFFDVKDWGLLIERHNKISELEKSEKMLSMQIQETRAELNLLRSDAQSIERYAREKYYMKKDNEDIFLVKTP
jgi:cell division protein DivIC